MLCGDVRAPRWPVAPKRPGGRNRRDPSGGAIALAVWLTGWPVLAVIVAGAPVALVSGLSRGGGAIAALSIALPTVVLVRLVSRDPVDS
jgi:hypothetical protein